MKKTVIAFIVFAILISFVSCQSQSEDDVEDMVYSSEKLRDTIYELIEKTEEFSEIQSQNKRLIKESITQLYTIDAMGFAQTGKLELIPEMYDSAETFTAKVVDSENKFAGIVWVDYEKSKNDLSMSYYEKSSISSSYVDHAERIKKALNYDEYVSVYDVKLVTIPYVLSVKWNTRFFYVDDGKTQAFISMYDFVDENSTRTPYVLSVGDIKQVADPYFEEQMEISKEIAECESRGEKYSAQLGWGCLADLYSGDKTIERCKVSVDNIIDIPSFIEQHGMNKKRQ